ncbi:hypothetical protein [Agromyces indicus]|uniref:Uncharacterized protein n=1 Tax=Agromyces indicus TaxID=758919 RepID=A0ABU1FJB5_9MICO|nr:hypothetical protein [Agromyces indicus]MDR5691865.1 hypothetical protein [Agromyces indicus]
MTTAPTPRLRYEHAKRVASRFRRVEPFSTDRPEQVPAKLLRVVGVSRSDFVRMSQAERRSTLRRALAWQIADELNAPELRHEIPTTTPAEARVVDTPPETLATLRAKYRPRPRVEAEPTPAAESTPPASTPSPSPVPVPASPAAVVACVGGCGRLLPAKPAKPVRAYCRHECFPPRPKRRPRVREDWEL